MAEFDWINDLQRGGRGGDGGTVVVHGVSTAGISPERLCNALDRDRHRFGGLGWKHFLFHREANEEAVILRLGEVDKVVGPGFHGRAPFGIDKVYKGAVKTVHQAEFGYRTLAAGIKSI